MKRRTDISTKFEPESDTRKGTTFCFHCHKKFQEFDEIVIYREHVIEEWDAFANYDITIPVRHPRYHIGCYFILKSQDNLPKNNVKEATENADYHNWKIYKKRKEQLEWNETSITAQVTKRRKI